MVFPQAVNPVSQRTGRWQAAWRCSPRRARKGGQLAGLAGLGRQPAARCGGCQRTERPRRMAISRLIGMIYRHATLPLRCLGVSRLPRAVCCAVWGVCAQMDACFGVGIVSSRRRSISGHGAGGYYSWRYGASVAASPPSPRTPRGTLPALHHGSSAVRRRLSPKGLCGARCWREDSANPTASLPERTESSGTVARSRRASGGPGADRAEAARTCGIRPRPRHSGPAGSSRQPRSEDLHNDAPIRTATRSPRLGIASAA